MKCHSAIKRNKLLIHTPWMNLKDIMLGERKLVLEIYCCIIPFIWYSQKDKTNVLEDRSEVASGYRWRKAWLPNCSICWFIEVMGLFCMVMMVMVVTWIYTWIKIGRNVHQKMVKNNPWEIISATFIFFLSSRLICKLSQLKYIAKEVSTVSLGDSPRTSQHPFAHPLSISFLPSIFWCVHL